MQPVCSVSANPDSCDAHRQATLVRAAHEFEGQMMKELLQPLIADDSLEGDEENPGSGLGSTNAMGEFAAEALGRAMSDGGGFGIASRIVSQLSHPGTEPGTASGNGTPGWENAINHRSKLK